MESGVMAEQVGQGEQAVDMNDFDAGFNDGVDTADTPAIASEKPEVSDGALPEVQPEQQQEQPEQGTPVTVAPVEHVAPLPAEEQIPQADNRAEGAALISAAKVEIDEVIAGELAELEKLSPIAAEMAREDSPEGAILRDRLERIGADSAFDRAEIFLERRASAVKAAQAQQRAVEAHNKNFQQVLRNEHPDLFDTSRTPKQNQDFMNDVKVWIEGKPYSEAKSLMEIYERGRDPKQVANLLTKFKQESSATAPSAGKKSAVDPTAMMAVAGRGAPIVPKTIGDKDDFDAGWNL